MITISVIAFTFMAALVSQNSGILLEGTTSSRYKSKSGNWRRGKKAISKEVTLQFLEFRGTSFIPSGFSVLCNTGPCHSALGIFMWKLLVWVFLPVCGKGWDQYPVCYMCMNVRFIKKCQRMFLLSLDYYMGWFKEVWQGGGYGDYCVRWKATWSSYRMWKEHVKQLFTAEGWDVTQWQSTCKSLGSSPATYSLKKRNIPDWGCLLALGVICSSHFSYATWTGNRAVLVENLPSAGSALRVFILCLLIAGFEWVAGAAIPRR